MCMKEYACSQNLEGEIIQLILSWQKERHVTLLIPLVSCVRSYFSALATHRIPYQQCTSLFGEIHKMTPCGRPKQNNRSKHRIPNGLVLCKHNSSKTAHWIFMKLVVKNVIHNLQMCMKEYGCCPKFGLGSTYTFKKSGEGGRIVERGVHLVKYARVLVFSSPHWL